MSSIWRLWAKIRQPAARRWEFHNKRPYLAHQGGRGILGAVFLQALEAESAHYEGVSRFTAAVLWDLSNYYEHSNRDKWFSRAADTGFNRAVAVLIANQYGSPRLVANRSQAVFVGSP
eukprot:8782159-Pyramimonas_sp.AAC.1